MSDESNTAETAASAEPLPDVSFVMPCYNEEAVVRHTINTLFEAFSKAGFVLQLVAVDNGSSDRTGVILQELSSKFPHLVRHRIDVNEGYGNGLLVGFSLCESPWIGTIPADGQVDAEDVVQLYQAAIASDADVMCKVRRRFRMDGVRRKVISTAYNLMVKMLWPRIESLDINGVPKLMSRRVLKAMRLQSKGWLLDLEIMIKSYYMGVRILEFNSFARMRGAGVSHVRVGTIWEFLWSLFSFRFSSKWRNEFRQAAQRYAASSHNSAGKE